MNALFRLLVGSKSAFLNSFSDYRNRTQIRIFTTNQENFVIPYGTWKIDFRNEGSRDVTVKLNDANSFTLMGVSNSLVDSLSFDGKPYVERDDIIRSITFPTIPVGGSNKLVVFFHRIDKKQT